MERSRAESVYKAHSFPTSAPDDSDPCKQACSTITRPPVNTAMRPAATSIILLPHPGCLGTLWTRTKSTVAMTDAITSVFRKDNR